MKKLILSPLAFLACISTAAAQSFPKPPDVPAYVPVAVTYAAGTATNTLGDGSTNGGTPPAAALELPDIPAASTTGWLTGSPNYCNIDGVTCQEAKFRTHINGSHSLFDDPIRNYGQPGQSHCHTFFGNRGANAYSTYASLRNKPASTAGGGPLNGTAYWYPCLQKDNPFSDGKNYIVKPDFIIIYYAQDPSHSPRLTYLLQGLRYVVGTNMDDPDDSQQLKEIAAANAQPGTAGRYSYIGNGFGGWHCVGATPVSSPRLKNADGSDPFGGTCAAGAQFYAEFNAPSCWDGNNLWSPGGYKHFRTAIRDNTTGNAVCPQGWFEVPILQGKVNFTQNGPSDYMNWKLASDAMLQSKINSLPTCDGTYSNAPCKIASRTVSPGESFHTDWMNGWDRTTMRKWQNFCSGIGGNTPHQCDDGTVSATEHLIRGETAPDGSRSPQVDLTTTYGTGAASKMWQYGTQHNGPMTMTMGHN